MNTSVVKYVHLFTARHMALHDPDSSAAEKAIALKIGRQKKIQIIDGQQVKLTQLKNYDNGNNPTVVKIQ